MSGDPGPRIAFVTSVYDRTAVGGGTFVHYLRRAVEEGRLDLVFFSDDMRRADSSCERAVSIPDAVAGLPGGWITRAWYYHRAFLAAHAERPFDILWHNNALTALFDVLHGAPLPVVGMINDYKNAESRTPFATRRKYGWSQAMKRFCWHQMERFVVRRLDHVVVNSRFMRDQLRSTYGVDPEKVRILYKGVDLEQFPFVEPSPIARPVRILFVKSDYVTGGLHDLIAALDGFPVSVELTLVGIPASERPGIERAARDVGVAEVHVVEHVSRKEMPGYFTEHDLLCVPSRSEALGVVFLEALASGTPAVGSDAGGIPEALDSGRAGWLPKAQDPAALRRVLCGVIDDEKARERKVRHGRSHVASLSRDAMIRRMRAMAEEIHG